MSALRLTVAWPTGGAVSPMRRWVVGSATAHVVFAIGAIVLPGLIGGPRVPNDFPVVELVGGIPGPSTPTVAPPAPQPPAAEPEPQPPKEQVQAAPEPEPAPADVKPARKKPKKAEEKPKPVAPAPPVEAPAEESSDSSSVGAQAGSASAGATVESALAGDAQFAWYRASVTAALYGAWQAPPLAGVRDGVQVTIAFEIYRNGEVGRLAISESSGIPSLDRSALRAVADAAPLPPLPSAWRESKMTAGFVFRLYPEDF